MLDLTSPCLLCRLHPLPPPLPTCPCTGAVQCGVLLRAQLHSARGVLALLLWPRQPPPLPAHHCWPAPPRFVVGGGEERGGGEIRGALRIYNNITSIHIFISYLCVICRGREVFLSLSASQASLFTLLPVALSVPPTAHARTPSHAPLFLCHPNASPPPPPPPRADKYAATHAGYTGPRQADQEHAGTGDDQDKA